MTILGTACLIYYKCYILCMRYVSRGLAKVRGKSWLNDLYDKDKASSVGMHQHRHYKDWIDWFSKHVQYLHC